MNQDFLKKLPIPISGLILAILSLGNLVQSYNIAFKAVCGIMAIVLIALLIIKLFLYMDIVRNDLSNPIILMNSGTFSMALMILSTYVNQFSGICALSIWILGIAIHILLIVYVTYHYIVRNFNITMVYPSCWIVFVGITMAAITAHVHDLFEIAIIFFIFGFSAMIISLPVVIYRYLKYPAIPNSNKPLICIFTALFSILIVGYVNSFSSINFNFLMILYAIACLFYLFSLYKIIEYRNLKFYPSYSAFSFPFVISTVASGEVMAITHNIILSYVTKIQLIIAVVLVAYVLFKYLEFLFSNNGL